MMTWISTQWLSQNLKPPLKIVSKLYISINISLKQRGIARNLSSNISKNNTLHPSLLYNSEKKSRFSEYRMASVSKNPEDYATRKNLSPSPYTKLISEQCPRTANSEVRASSKSKIKRSCTSMDNKKILKPLYNYMKKQKYTFAREIMVSFHSSDLLCNSCRVFSKISSRVRSSSKTASILSLCRSSMKKKDSWGGTSCYLNIFRTFGTPKAKVVSSTLT